ncbi:hypothetical protein LZ30DRAFT_723214 [Colletotrichum cereale]|nr:hypothetical protein LZ30DRAFT_723214 [Colletotrichum cereale]
MRKSLRRVQKEEDMSLQVREQKSADVESWRSQLRKTQARDENSPGEQQGEDANYGDCKRADTCLTCRHETPSPPPSLTHDVKTTPDVLMNTSETASDPIQQGQNGQSYKFRQKHLKEMRVSSSSRSTSKTLEMTKVESDTVTHVSQTSEVVHSNVESVLAEETRVDSAERANVDSSRSCADEVEVFSPMPIMPPNHTCS